MDEPFKVVFTDVYTVGNNLSFQGYKNYMCLCDGMSTFATMEPISTDDINSNGFAKDIMKILLQY
eukprot:13176471-Ditylum_brightwellii.AAC.1